MLLVNKELNLLRNWFIEERFEMSVSTERFPDVTSSTVLGPELNRFEPVDVAPVEEHEPDDG